MGRDARFHPIAAPVAAAIVLVAASAAAAQQVRYGPEHPLGNGTVRTYLLVDAQGAPAELGFAISETAMSTLPDLADKPPMESFLTLHLELPEGAPAPYRMGMFDWNPKGHIPEGIYTVPHFDFHFYTVEKALVDGILPGESDAPGPNFDFVGTAFEQRGMKAPAEGLLPPHYVNPGGTTVPAMGGHWIDPTSHEFHGKPFDKTFIYGTWDGELIFLEPMITKAYIESTADEMVPIVTPSRYPAPGLYPTAYRIYKDAAAKEYRIALSGFAQQN